MGLHANDLVLEMQRRASPTHDILLAVGQVAHVSCARGQRVLTLLYLVDMIPLFVGLGLNHFVIGLAPRKPFIVGLFLAGSACRHNLRHPVVNLLLLVLSLLFFHDGDRFYSFCI